MIREQKTRDEILKKRSKKKSRKILPLILGIFVVTGLIIFIAGVLIAVGGYMYFKQDLPKITSLKDYNPPTITTFYADDNRKIAEFYDERRIVIPLSYMPDMLINAFIAAEDDRFYQHKGINLLSILRAFLKNIEAGTIVQGGSTITQQVTKSFLLSPEKSYQRKIKEIILAYRIDKTFSKDDILFLYLNQIYLGHGAYGVQAAAENYFDKDVQELTLAECAILAGLPRAPSRYSPFRYPERAQSRQAYVLNRMVAEGYITDMEAAEALNEPLNIKPRRNFYLEKVPYYTEYVRQYVEKKYGRDLLYNGGLQVYTSVNVDMQKTAVEEIEKGLRDLDKRQGYRGPIKKLSGEEIETFSRNIKEELKEKPLEKNRMVQGVVTEINDSIQETVVRIGDDVGIIPLKTMAWARKPDSKIAYHENSVKKPGDVLSVGDLIEVKIIEKQPGKDIWELALEQEPAVQSALLCLESGTGNVKAMVGGRDFEQSQFNRAIQSRRQPGSAFKPVVYAAALDKGYTTASIILDTAVVYENREQNFVWKPKNYSQKFYGPTLFREALAQSRNLVTIKILKDIGVGYAINYARKLGIVSPLQRDLSLALGSSGISLLELVNAYSVFANMGYYVTPIFVTKILDRRGNILEESRIEKERVIEKSTAYLITSLLESVVKDGTGKKVRALNRPVAGKTGTTNDMNDAWFVGYTPQYITGTWVGFDEKASLGKGETGSSAAAPIWLEFMSRIMEGEPIRVFEVPDDIVFARIDAETGLLPIPESKKTIFECFKQGTVPQRQSVRQDIKSDYDEFFKSGM